MRTNRLLLAALCAVLLTGALAGCNTDDYVALSEAGAAKGEASEARDTGSVTAAAEEETAAVPADPLEGIDAEARVVALTRPVGELWLLAGGQLVGTTDDALDLPGLKDQDVTSLGETDAADADDVLSCEPDLVLLPADLPALDRLSHALEKAKVPVLTVDVRSFDDYDAVMAQLTEATDHADLYEQNVERVRAQIEAVVSNSAQEGRGSFVALGVSAEGEETLAGDSFVTGMLTDLGLSDAATTTGAMTLAQLCKVDPDWLFVVYQGDEAAAQTAFAKDFQAQEEWATLSAAQQGRVVMLPKALFSQVPNAKWGEAYAYLSQVLHGAWA